MDIWERTQGGRAPSTSSHSGAQIRDKDFDGMAWSTKHDGDFRSLIVNARKKVVKPSIPEEAKQDEPISTEALSLEDAQDTEMVKGNEDNEQPLLNPSSSPLLREVSTRSRFFQEINGSAIDGLPSSSSQHQSSMSVDKEPFIPDIATSKPIQP